MVDLHAHVLPGLDDGPATMEEALEAGRAAVAAGVTILAATPHVRHDYPTTPGQMEEALAAVREAFAHEELELDLRGGGELDIEWLRGMEPTELRRFGLAGNSRYVLVEFPYVGWPLGLPELVFRLRVDGMTPVLAHPEISADVAARPGRLREVVEAGALVQVTASALDGRYGAEHSRTAGALLEAGLVHLVASDAHGAKMRGFDFAGAIARIGDPPLARWLVHDVPAAIANDVPLPERPVSAERPGRIARLRSRARRARG